jgi:membrane protein
VKIPARVETIVARVMGWQAVRHGRDVLQRYDDAAGELLAGGLTYSALFALLPCLLLLSGVLGLLVSDPVRQQGIVSGIGDSLPPLRGLVAANVASMAHGAVGFGTLGLIGFAWGASRFYASLDDAFARIFRDAPKRGLLTRTLRGILSVGLLVGVFVVALGLTAIGSFMAQDGRFGGVVRFVFAVSTPVLATAVFVAAIAAIYRLVPACFVSWRSLLLPAAVVGVVLALVTQLFSNVATLLIGSAALFGTFVAIFAAMIWLSIGFQVLLVGAAWVSERLGRPPSVPAATSPTPAPEPTRAP